MIALLRGWHAQSFRAMASSLRQAIAGRESMLHATAQKVLSLPALASVVDKSLNSLSELEFQELSGILNSYFLQYELERCLPLLREAIFAPLIAWLVEEGATSLTLIPCGPLAAFPLMAVPLTDTQTVGDRLPTSVAPNARSLLKEQQTSNEQPVPATRKGLYAFGDPRPTRQPLLFICRSCNCRGGRRRH